MKRMRIVGLCLVALCSVFAISATSAVATEGSREYGECLKKTGGKYKNGGCTKFAKSTAEEKFEWTKLSKAVAITSKKKEAGKAVLEAASGKEISCTEQVQTVGEFGPGQWEVKGVIGEFSGCEASGAECESASPGKAGFINTFKLHGEPGVVTKEVKGKEEKNLDGVDLRAEVGTPPEGLLAEFTCGPLAVKVKGGIVTKAGAIVSGKFKAATNKMTTKNTVEFVAEKVAKQVPNEWTPDGHNISNAKQEKIEENLKSKLSIEGSYENSGQSLITVQSTKTKLELRQCEKNVC